MSAIAKVIKVLLTLAALVTSVETLMRLVRFAWSLVLKLGQLLGRRGAVPNFAKIKFA
jgi:hypothetical protein